ncbi:hypothetical protein SEEB0220_06910 [Salmonella enterica subsp. enterica serovar Bareilly str. CFSAN000220]|nr:hypothetical protein SEEB0220_06910 [Salmonella enterica subsp. enterica serovar Bareilly str. CFSAN000220]
MRFECRRAMHILTLQVTFFDTVRHIAAGTNVGRSTAERATHHDSNPRAFRLASRSRIFSCQTFRWPGVAATSCSICGSVETDSPVLNSTGSSVRRISQPFTACSSHAFTCCITANSGST